ncbi:MAG: hypothetical protein JSR24_14440 [Proteobacteria bacterium]|nr:hypothetical protein [Pseudomonadota bacterium]
MRLSGQVLLAFVASLLVLGGLIAWLQNVHIVTANGMYKSIQAEPWIADFAHARLDPSNYLFFPLYGASSRLFDALGLLRGMAWMQFAYFNAFWASVGVVVVYAFVHRVTGSAWTAALASLFHLGSGFVLLLSVINEDIMPGYVLVLAAMALAGIWFQRPTYRQVVLVAALFTLGWLVEWRLIFPTLPALGLALLLSQGTLKEKLLRAVVLVVSIVAVAGIVQQIWEGHTGAVGLHDLLWTGKGVATGWAGIGWDKAWMMLSGVGNYLLLVGGFVDPVAARRAAGPLALSVAFQAAIFVAAAVVLWPRRHEPRVRAIALVFIGTLGAGQVMNFYSQPQDPQMQVNVMGWLTVAWATVVAACVARPRLRIVLALLSFVPLAWNVAALAHHRGGDRDALEALATLERALPPEQTVFVYWGFEDIAMWQYAMWGRTWDLDEGNWEPPPRFKWIALDAAAIRHPGWTAEQHAQSIRRGLDLAFDRGWRVVIGAPWTWSEAELAGQLGGLSAANRAPAIHRMLHDTYVATPVLDVKSVGTYYELRRKSAH